MWIDGCKERTSHPQAGQEPWAAQTTFVHIVHTPYYYCYCCEISLRDKRRGHS